MVPRDGDMFWIVAILQPPLSRQRPVGLNNSPGETIFGEKRLQRRLAISIWQNSSPFGLTALQISLQITTLRPYKLPPVLHKAVELEVCVNILLKVFNKVSDSKPGDM
jgi:hypothetical protein